MNIAGVPNTVAFDGYRVPDPIIRVGWDIDNTKVHNDILWARYFHHGPCLDENAHRHVPLDEISLTYDHFKNLCRPCFNHVALSPEIVRSHAVLPGVVPTLATLYATGCVWSHDVTARPKSLYGVTVDWLRENGIAPYIAGVTFAFDKRPVVDALGLDFIVDDNPAAFEELRDHAHCRVIVPDMPYNQHLAAELRAYSWDDILSILLAEIEQRSRAA